MKKVLIATVALFFAAITHVNAQTTQPPLDKKEMTAKPQKADAQTKTPVKPEALPDAIKTTTSGEDYKGWVISSAYLVKAATEYYEVTLTKDKETKTIMFDKNGKPII